MADTYWDSSIEISKDEKCPHITGKHEPKILIPLEIWQKITTLTQELDTEWLGYLKGSHLTSGEWKVTDIVVPKQEVSSVTVKPAETVHSEGVVHSHNDMRCYFSGTDDDFLNENHDFSIVVNKDGDSKAVVRVKLPCGALTIVEAEVLIEYPEVKDAKEFIKQAKKNIVEEKPVWQGYVNRQDLGVPDYVPKRKRKQLVEPFDYGDSYDLAGWY